MQNWCDQGNVVPDTTYRDTGEVVSNNTVTFLTTEGSGGGSTPYGISACGGSDTAPTATIE